MTNCKGFGMKHFWRIRFAIPGFAWRNCGWSTTFFSCFSNFSNRDSKQTPSVTSV